MYIRTCANSEECALALRNTMAPPPLEEDVNKHGGGSAFRGVSPPAGRGWRGALGGRRLQGLRARGLSRLAGGAEGRPGRRSPGHGGAAAACQLGVAPGTHSRPPVEQRPALPTGKAFAPLTAPLRLAGCAPPPIGAVRLSAARSI